MQPAEQFNKVINLNGPTDDMNEPGITLVLIPLLLEKNIIKLIIWIVEFNNTRFWPLTFELILVLSWNFCSLSNDSIFGSIHALDFLGFNSFG